jgi:pimeloyl-ACP methyl ester carboxylesterase
LRQIFTLKRDVTPIERANVHIRIMSFTSNSSLILPSNGIDEQTYFHQTIATNDSTIAENSSFSYPVFVPNTTVKHNKAIVLLHGLNERSWLKYLPWAYYLAIETNRPVILFPISFHMNRSPENWANPRAMMPLLSKRQKMGELSMATFANVALSQRLSDDPLRFFASGKQSAEDIVQLLETIKVGDYPLLEKNSQVDFFSYSIGAFLAQILFLANPKSLLSNARLFMFCGGAHFSEMYGTSRLIMDSDAYASLRKYYLDEFIKELKIRTPFSVCIKKSLLGEAFLGMLSPETNKEFRESRLQSLKSQIRIISLKNDRVIPSNFIQSTFSSIKNKAKGIVQELDFPFDYSHEVPFPIFTNENKSLVDKAFADVFIPAVEFLK